MHLRKEFLVKAWVLGFIDEQTREFMETCYLKDLNGNMWASKPARHDMSFGKFQGWRKARGIPCGAIFIGNYEAPHMLRTSVIREVSNSFNIKLGTEEELQNA